MFTKHLVTVQIIDSIIDWLVLGLISVFGLSHENESDRIKRHDVGKDSCVSLS
jgi:hypothetical protein